MKLLVVNPNSSETVTAAIMASARRGATAGTELVGVTTKGGTRKIDCAFADYLSGAFMIRTCLESLELHHPDAVVLAGFGRVGIDALKEALEIPVVSISEASMAVASLLGHRFTTLTMLDQFIPYQQDLVLKEEHPPLLAPSASDRSWARDHASRRGESSPPRGATAHPRRGPEPAGHGHVGRDGTQVGRADRSWPRVARQRSPPARRPGLARAKMARRPGHRRRRSEEAVSSPACNAERDRAPSAEARGGRDPAY
jgi:Asp/Glu/Hydantoin racemase